jgi:hypothetical protein
MGFNHEANKLAKNNFVEINCGCLYFKVRKVENKLYLFEHAERRCATHEYKGLYFLVT